ncbi:CDP-alcohol phosphatidyltransferase family protein [Actinoplanes sp. NPDC049265]|uniref:CDP-alcohol phosphatidyltransferase family protein n=1 Tax=Actinoplanes sp. NPDC049265 TaxID=3363902 RepID=UPI00371202E7
MTWDAYAVAWASLHGGFDPRTASPLIRGWIRIAWRAGVLLARLGLGPMAVTAGGLLLCLLVPVAALAGPAGWIGAGILVAAAAFADSFDGAVAVVTGRATRLGFVVDSVADRIGEAAWLLALWLAGAPAGLVVAAGGLSWLHEYVRARATAGGMADIGMVTVGERPTRIAVAIPGLLIAGVSSLVLPLPIAAVAVAAGLALQLVGLVQLFLTVRRELR